MRTFARRCSPLVAAAYLLAGWLAGALHAHVPIGDGEEACTTCCCGHHHAADDAHDRDGNDRDGNNAGETPSGDSQRKSHGSDDEHHCVVCHFFAQPPLTVDNVVFDPAVESLPLAASAVAPTVETAPLTAWWSRGPPAA